MKALSSEGSTPACLLIDSNRLYACNDEDPIIRVWDLDVRIRILKIYIDLYIELYFILIIRTDIEWRTCGVLERA